MGKMDIVEFDFDLLQCSPDIHADVIKKMRSLVSLSDK